MKRETISTALGEIDAHYVEEALSHRPRKTAQLLKRIGAIAACLVVACGVIWNAASAIRFAIKDKGKGEVLNNNISEHGSLIWVETALTYVPPQVQTGNYTAYAYAGNSVSKERIGEMLETAQVLEWNGEDSMGVDIYAIQGVDPMLAVCFVFGDSHCVYYNDELEFSTLSELWTMANICENVNFLSVDVYEYRTKNTTYCREYQSVDAETEAFYAVLRELDGEIVPDGKYVWHTPQRIAYLYGKFDGCYETTRIIVEDTGYFIITMDEAYWCETFYIGVENAVRFIDAIETLPRKQKEESTHFFDMTDATMTETARVEETTSE